MTDAGPVMAVVLIGVAGFVGCLVLMLLSFAFAYGLITLGIWGWAAFLIVAGVYVLLAGLAVLVALRDDPQAQRVPQDTAHGPGGPGMLRGDGTRPAPRPTGQVSMAARRMLDLH